MLEKDMVVEGPLWPEAVRVLGVEAFGTMLQVDAVGTRSRQFYPGIIVTEGQRGLLKVMSAAGGIDFSGDPEAFRLAIEAHRIRLAYEVDPHFAVSSSTITPLPHQLDAVYQTMLKSPLVRFLLADDPGAGKTIMAGLLIKELRFRGLADRILIVVPPLVARQWQEEMEQKFAETFHVIDGGVLRANVGKNPWAETDRCITSVYWAARDNVLAGLKEADWDLVIVDEAHKMAAYRQGTKSDKTKKTRLYRLGEELSERTRHLLLLTATPHKGDPENFRLLMQLLDRDLFADRSILEEALRSKDNPILLRRLKEEMKRFDGSPLFPPRTVKTIAFDLTRAEKALYEEVTAYVTDHFNKAIQKDKRNVGFAMAILQRRLTSSLAAVTASIKRRFEALSALLAKVQALAASRASRALAAEGDSAAMDELLGGAEIGDLEDLGETDRWQAEEDLVQRLTNAESIDELHAEVLALEQLLRRAQSVSESGVESKYNQLLDSILRDQGILASGEKLLIFTEAKDTLDFLVKRLRQEKLTVAVIDGSLPMNKRREQQELFRGAAQVMVATEAGGESINLQFCNQMVNYDIPWNPNRLEQRMGRIHRIGQKNEVFIFNLVATDTREGAVLATLLRKMEEMRKGLGSDRVFDLVGDLLEDHEISLADIILDCITHRRRLEDVVAKIDAAVSPEHHAALVAAREEGLARRFLNLPRLREEATRSAAAGLVPAQVQRFFLGTLQRQRGRASVRADGAVRVERVPMDLRRDRDLEFRRRHGEVRAEYPSIVFDRARVKEDGSAELVGPGHALFESVLQAAEAGFAGDLLKGAVFVDPSPNPPDRLWFFSVAIGDGTGRVLGRRLIAVEERQRNFNERGALCLQDVRPWSPHDGAKPPPADVEREKRVAIGWLLETTVPKLVRETAEGRAHELELRERYLDRSFRSVIARHSDRLLAMQGRQAGGDDMALAIRQEERMLEDARRRQDERMRQIRLEKQIVTRAPELVGVAAVVPGAPLDSLVRERALQRHADWMSGPEGLRPRALAEPDAGYEYVTSQPESGAPLFVTSKVADAEGRFWLRRTEWDQVDHLGLAVIVVGDEGVRVVPASRLHAAEDRGPRVRVEVVGA